MAEQFIESTLMDGYVGGPHITETQTGLANQGLYGQDDYVLSAGRKAEAQILTNNSIRIFDAVFVIQGRRDVIAANDYTDVSIDNGAQGMNRNDIIVRRYTKDESSEIENTEYAVIKGTPAAGEAEDPEVTIGDIRSGDLLHEMKLYRVKLEGLNIVAVEPLFQVLMDMSTINAYLSDTGWQPLGSNAQYRKKAGVVTIIGNSDNEITLPKFDEIVTLGTLPESCRPITDLFTLGTAKSSSGYAVQVRTYNTGEVTIVSLNPNITVSYWSFVLSYPV